MAISVKIAGTTYRCADDYSITQQGAAVSQTRLNVLLGANPVPLILQTAQILIDGTAFFLGLIQNVGTPEYSTTFETQVFSLSVASLECLMNMRLVTHNFYLSSTPTYADVVQWIFDNIISEEGITLGSISTTTKTYTSKWLITRQKAGDILNEICTKIGNAAWWISVDRKFYFKVSTDFTSVVAPTALSALKLEEDIGGLRTTEIVTGASSKIVGTDSDAALTATIAARTGGSGKIEVVENDTTIHNPTKAGTEAELRLARNAESEKTITCLCHDLTKSTLYNLWPLNLSINGVSIVGNFVVVERTISNLYSKTAASVVNIRVKLKNANYFAKYGYSIHDAVTVSNDAMAEIADISNDDILSPSDKIRARDNWNIVASEKDALDDQADAYGITTQKASFDNAFTALANYLNGGTSWVSGYPLWLADATLSETLEIVGTDFEAYWRTYYDARVALQVKITNSPLMAQYSINGTSSWHSTWVTGDLYMRQSSDGGTTWGDAIRIVGENGAPGANGQFVDYRFAKNSSPTSAPSYTADADSPGANWYDTPQSLAAGEYQWMIKSTWRDTTRLSVWTPPARLSGEKGETGPQGPQGDQGTQGPAGANGATTYFHVAYATASDGSAGFNHSSGPYIGTYVDTTSGDSSDYHAYTWRQFVGSQGPEGDQGIPGTAGADGTVYYLHLAYATSADGSQGFSTSVTTGKTYIGTCVDTNATDPETYASYAWIKFEGPQGPQGIQGTQGVPGTSKYFHVRYSANADGTGFNTTPNTYIGTAVTESETAPTDKAGYTWTQFKGDTGSQGIQGPTGPDGATYYLHIAYATAADGSTGFSTSDSSGKTYLGQCVNTSATDPETPASYAWTLIQGPQGAQGPQGNQGTQGPAGANGATTYFHVAYATAADGSAGFNHSSGPYIGTYVDTTATDSEVYTSYTWRQFVGPTGSQGAQGDQGIPGVKGDDGTTYYLHIAYANSADGVTGFSTTDGSGKAYMGQCVDTTLADPTTPASYTWTLVKGADGQNAIVMTSATAPAGTYDNQVGLWNSQLYTWSVSLGAWVNADATLPTDTPAVYLSFDEVPDIPDDPAGGTYISPSPWVDVDSWNSNSTSEISISDGKLKLVSSGADYLYIEIFRSITLPAGKCLRIKLAWDPDITAIRYYNGTTYTTMTLYHVGDFLIADTVTTGSYTAFYWHVLYASGAIAATKTNYVYQIYLGTGAYLTPALDNSGSGKHGTNNGITSVVGVSGKGFYRGIDAGKYIRIPDISYFTGDFCLSFWAKIEVISDWCWFFGQSSYGGLTVSAAGGSIRWSLGAWFTDCVTAVPYALQAGQWYHIVVGRQAGVTKTYVNGAPHGTGISNSMSSGVGDLFIGAGVNAVESHSGVSMDEVALWYRGLTASEIRGLYLAKSLPKLYTMADYRLAEAADDGKITTPEKVSWAMPKWWDIYAATDVTSAMPSAPSVVGEYKTLRDAANAVSIWTPTGAGTAAKAYYDAAEALRAYLFTTPGVLLTSSWAATITITKATWLGLWNTYKTTAQALSAAINAAVAAADATTKANAAQSYAAGLASALQTQVDRAITYYTQAGDPSTAWTTDALKKEHIGDYWRTAAGAVWTQWSGTAWTTISDPVAQAAASAAQGTADGAATAASNAASAASNAQTTANNAASSATTANNLLADIASDSKLTPVEKTSARSEWNVIAAELTANDAQATAFGITTEKTAYDNAFQALATYLNAETTWTTGVPSWLADANLGTTTDITGATFRTNWKAYYDARTALLNAIAAKAKTLADAAQSAANIKTTLWATLALAQASGVAGDMFLDASLLYRATVAAASITLANSTRLTPKRYADVANATARGALTGMILGDTVYQTDTLQWYVYTTSWVVDGPAMTTVAETYSPHYLGRSEAAHPAGHHPGDSWMVFDTDDTPIQRGIWYSNAGTPERITTSSSALLQAKMIQALPDVAWAEANSKGTSTDYGFNTFFEAIAAVTAFFNAMWAKEVTLVAAGWLKSHDYAVDGDGFPTAGFMLDVLNQSINSFGSIFTNATIRNALITNASFEGVLNAAEIFTSKANSATFTATASYLGSAIQDTFNLLPSESYTTATGTFNSKTVNGIRNTGIIDRSLGGGLVYRIRFSDSTTLDITQGHTYTYAGSITVAVTAKVNLLADTNISRTLNGYVIDDDSAPLATKSTTSNTSFYVKKPILCVLTHSEPEGSASLKIRYNGTYYNLATTLATTNSILPVVLAPGNYKLVASSPGTSNLLALGIYGQTAAAYDTIFNT